MVEDYDISDISATYTVTIAIDAGAGMLRLDIPDAATISDLAGLSVNNLPFTTGESYTVSIPTPTPTATPDGQSKVYVPLVQR